MHDGMDTSGSGTILEALSLNKTTIVVVNEKLMDNHQTEIAHVMGQSSVRSSASFPFG